tara:strand:- start:724 stop:942 length:219 start_codon:yes stop_codon:yes gene_type:complete
MLEAIKQTVRDFIYQEPALQAIADRLYGSADHERGLELLESLKQDWQRKYNLPTGDGYSPVMFDWDDESEAC